MTTELGNVVPPRDTIGDSDLNTPTHTVSDTTAILREEPATAAVSQTNNLAKATAFGRSFIAMFNRFLERTFQNIQARPDDKLLWFTWSNEFKGRHGLKFFVDLKKNGTEFVLEVGVPGDVKSMTLNFQVLLSRNFIFLRRRNPSQDLKISGVLWFFRVDDDNVTFASNPFRKAVDKNSWLLGFLERIQTGNNKPVGVQLSFNSELNDDWRKSFHDALNRLLTVRDEDDNSYWVRSQEDDTEDNTKHLIERLENQFLDENDPVIYEMAMTFLASLILRWFTYSIDADVPIPGFPQNDDMHNVRPVDLNPYDVNAELQERGLNYPYQVIIAACSALNAGKHLILSGPPGNGKTELAVQLAKIAGVSLISATANPSWTAAEMMGRYMPKEKGGLEFVPGYFLSAIENSNDKRWLLIDEFNRADIDTCMGELFTILSNQAVVLPFRAHDDGKEATEAAESESIVPKRIAIIPTTANEQDGAEKRSRQADAALYKTYVVPPEFRILATMNDSDASRLNPLSFALRRRFVILRVEAPAKERRRTLIGNRLKKIIDAEENEKSFYDLKRPQVTIAKIFKATVQELLFALFASDDSMRQDFLDMRLIGVGQVFDVIDFIKEGLRAPNAGDSSKDNDKLDFSNVQGGQDSIKELIASYAALAVEMMVFPQLDACDDVNFETAISLIANVFKNHNFLVVEVPEKEQSGIYYVRQHDRYPKINTYLADKLKSQYSYQPDRLRTVEMIFGKKAES